MIDDLGNYEGNGRDNQASSKADHCHYALYAINERRCRTANQYGHEVIVHLPMEPKKGKKSWLGPGAIMTDLSDNEIRKRVEDAVKDVQHAVGMNHHMGSKARKDERVENGFFYLDSKTTGKSVVGKLVNELDVPFLRVSSGF